jgi:hypothetical protein
VFLVQQDVKTSVPAEGMGNEREEGDGEGEKPNGTQWSS